VTAVPPSGGQPEPRDPGLTRTVSAYVAALGGGANIVRIDACAATRLRIVVRDERDVRESALRGEGIAVVKLDNQTFHLIVGLDADQYAAEMRGQLATASSTRTDTAA
jgi:PTS system glucose-specific IIC component